MVLAQPERLGGPVTAHGALRFGAVTSEIVVAVPRRLADLLVVAVPNAGGELVEAGVAVEGGGERVG